MKSFFLHFIALLFVTSAFAQVDSFAINQYTFKFITPDGWTLHSKDNGLCEYSETNVNATMPLTCKKCYGSLMISISEITDSEKKRRSIENDTIDPFKLDEASYEKKYDHFLTGCGYYDAKTDDDSVIYVNSRGDLVISKPKKKEKGLTRVHHYARWCYFPINDSLEILIYFRGLIPHDEETNADAAVNQVAQHFFKTNRSVLDTMLVHTDTFVFKRDTLPMDSLYALKTYLHYPVIPEWRYDTTRIIDEQRTTLLRIVPPMPDSCDDGSMTVSYTIGPYDPKDDIAMYQLINATLYFGEDKVEQYLKKAGDSTGFSNKKQHYYFNQKSETETRQDCPQYTRYFESTYVCIFPKPDERIIIKISFMGTSGSDKRRESYFKAYYQFVYQFATMNDFEQIYLLNKT
jgi:hypothetical protein